MNQPKRVFNKKYEVIKELGKGAFGVVFKARNIKLNKLVAIKTMLVDGGKDHDVLLERFKDEARNTSKLSHPNNISVYDFGVTKDDELFIVMEMIDGVELAELPLPIPIDRALEIIYQVAGALQEAHDVGMIHRDIKPANVMIAQVNNADHAYVLDYGIAKVAGSTTKHTKAGAMVGSLAYASPEQTRGEKLDPRTDIYSLGVTLYELLANDMPFVGTLTEVVLQIINAPVRPFPSELNVPPEIEAFVQLLMAKDREDRPESMSEVRQKIEILRNPYIVEKQKTGAIAALVRGRKTDGATDKTKIENIDWKQIPKTSLKKTKELVLKIQNSKAGIWVQARWDQFIISQAGIKAKGLFQKLKKSKLGILTAESWQKIPEKSRKSVAIAMAAAMLMISFSFLFMLIMLRSPKNDSEPINSEETVEIVALAPIQNANIGDPCGPCNLNQWIESSEGLVCDGNTACPTTPILHSLTRCDSIAPCADPQICQHGFCIDVRASTLDLEAPQPTTDVTWLQETWPEVVPLSRNVLIDASQGKERLYETPTISGEDTSRIYNGAALHVLESRCGDDGGRWARVRVLSNPNDDGDHVGLEGWIRRQALLPHGNGCCQGRSFDCGWRDEEGSVFLEADPREETLSVTDREMTIRSTPVYNHDLDNRVTSVRRRQRVTSTREICVPSGYRWVYVRTSGRRARAGWGLRRSLSGDSPSCCLGREQFDPQCGEL